MVRFYLTPAVVNAAGFRAPKYSDTLAKGTPWWSMDYGSEPTFLWAVDTDAATHATLAAEPDVAAFPANIDNQVGANLATVQAKLESFNLPGDMVTAATSYRQIIRGIIAIFKVLQRYTGITQNVLLFGADTNLDRTLGSIPANIRTALQQACDELGYDTSNLTGASTIRDLLKTLARQTRNTTVLSIVV